VLTAGAILSVASAADYEPNRVFKASEILPANLLSGPSFKVDSVPRRLWR
jgi:hypothetical protein